MNNELEMFNNIEQDMPIIKSNIDDIKEKINYLDDIDSLILELKRIRENVNKM